MKIKELEKKYKIALLLSTKDRAGEMGMLLTSILSQTFKSFSIYLQDDASQVPLMNFYFIQHLVNRLKLNGHMVLFRRNEQTIGISRMRNSMAKWAIEEDNNCNLFFRGDDDCIMEPDLLERLVRAINSREDVELVSGLTPPLGHPNMKRDTKFVKPFISEFKVDEMGNILQIGDDCGWLYLQKELIPSQHFRSYALYKKSIHTEKNIWYAENLTNAGWREEEFLAMQIIAQGGIILVDTGAINWHLLCPSGGNRFQNQEMMKVNDECLQKFVKDLFIKNGNFIDVYNKKILEETK